MKHDTTSRDARQRAKAETLRRKAIRTEKYRVVETEAA